MKGRTFRYFEGVPLYPFGYGLSYTQFSYSNLQLPKTPVRAGDPVMADVTVTNTGKLGGDEVAELCLTFPDVPGALRRALRGFQRLNLAPGESRAVHFVLSSRDVGMVTEAGASIIAEGRYTVTVGGGQPGTVASYAIGSFSLRGTQHLPE